MYVGMLSMLFGICILFGSLSVFISPVIFFLISHFYFIKNEERMLKDIFSKDYLEYKKVTRPWL